MSDAMNQSAVSIKSKVYKDSEKKFRKNALAGDYQGLKPGWEKDGDKTISKGKKDKKIKYNLKEFLEFMELNYK